MGCGCGGKKSFATRKIVKNSASKKKAKKRVIKTGKLIASKKKYKIKNRSGK